MQLPEAREFTLRVSSTLPRVRAIFFAGVCLLHFHVFALSLAVRTRSEVLENL